MSCSYQTRSSALHVNVDGTSGHLNYLHVSVGVSLIEIGTFCANDVKSFRLIHCDEHKGTTDARPYF